MSDTFTKAAANVRRLYSDEQWFSLPRGRRSEAICDELRRIDAECQAYCTVKSGISQHGDPRKALDCRTRRLRFPF